MGCDGKLKLHAARPVTSVERPSQCGGLLFGGGDNRDAESASGQQPLKLAVLLAQADIRAAFAGDVVGRSAKIDADEFEPIAVEVETVRSRRFALRQPGAAHANFFAGQSPTSSPSERRVEQHPVLPGQRLGAQGFGAVGADAKELRAAWPQHVILLRVKQRVLREVPRADEPIEQLADGVLREVGKESTSNDLVGDKSKTQ